MTKDKLAEALEKVTATEAQMKHVHHESVQIKKSNQMLVENVKDHQILETRAEESENLVAKLRIQLDQAQELNNYQEKQIAEKNSRVSLLEKSGHETEETSQALQAMLESTKMALGMAIDENDSLKAKASRDAKDIATFQLMINPLNEEIRNLKHEHAIDSETHEQLTDSLRSDLRSIEAQYNQLKKEVPRVTEEMMNLQRTVEELQAVIKEKDELLDEAATREQNLQGELLTLHQVNDDLLRDLTVARDKELRGKYSSNKGGGSNNGGGSSGAMGIGGTGALGRLAAMSIHEDDEPGEDFFNLRPALSLETNDGSSDADGSSGHAGAPMEIVPGSVDDVNVGSGTNRRFNLDSPGNKGTMDYSDVSLSVAERRARKNLTRLKTGELAVESGVGIRHQKSLRNFKHKKKKEPIIEPDGSIAAGTSAAGGDSESEEVEDDDEEEEEREGKLEVDVSSPVGGPGLSPGALSTNAAAQKQYNIRKYDVTPKPRVVSSRAGPNSRTRNGSGVGPGSGASGGGGMDDAEMMAELTAAKFSRPGGGPLSSYSSPVGRGGGSSNRTPQRNASVARRPSAIGSTGFRPQENVDLVSVREGATDEEIAMRDAILATLTATVGPIPAKKAINALTPVLALYGTLLTDALAGMWDSMVANKKASDFFCKTNIILERMLACTPENGITSYEVGKTCQDCIPLAMTSIGGGGGLVNSWHELTQINEHVVHDLGGTINYQTGEVTFKTYSDFFGHDEDHYLLKMEAAGIALAKMGIYGDEAVKALNTNMIALLKDWNEAKSTFIDIDSIVEEEKKIVRQAADREINSIIAELSNTFARLEVAKEAVKEGNKKVEVQTVELTTLRPLPQKLETSEQKVKDLLGKIKHITAEAEEVMVEHKNLKHHVVELNETITVQKSELVHIHQVEEQLRDNIVVLEETAVRSEARNVEVSKALDKVVTENHNRLHALNHVHVQTQPFHSDAGIQTEFICPPVRVLCVCAWCLFDVFDVFDVIKGYSVSSIRIDVSIYIYPSLLLVLLVALLLNCCTHHSFVFHISYSQYPTTTPTTTPTPTAHACCTIDVTAHCR